MQPARERRVARRAIVLVVVVVALAAAGAWYWFRGHEAASGTDLTFYGNVDVREISLAFEGTGRVLQVDVDEGAAVVQGQELARLDVSMLQLQLRQAQAQVDAQQQLVHKLVNGALPEEIDQAKSRLAAARAQLSLAVQALDRLTRLHEASSSSVSQQTVDQAAVQEQVARATVDQLQSALDLLERGARAEDIAAAEAQLEALRAQLAILGYQVGQGTLRAPSDAVVRSRLLEPGDMASPARPILALALTSPKWVRIYANEADLAHISPGMQATIAGSADEAPVTGTVGYISSVAEFTPKAVQTEELRTSLVYEVRIIIGDDGGALRLGQPVTVTMPLTPRVP